MIRRTGPSGVPGLRLREPRRADRGAAGVFDITREPGRRLSFGHGVHGCPGHQLARGQLRLTVEAFATRLPGLRPDPEQRVRMIPTLIHRTPQELLLLW
jgi:cytochrome P450